MSVSRRCRMGRWLAVAGVVIALVGAQGAVALAGAQGAGARGAFGRPVRAATTAPSHPPTIVSLEFDHAFTDQLPAIQLAATYGMHATVFAMSGRVGTPGYMTAAQLDQLQAQGVEIGGHTIDHPDLSLLPATLQRREICDDRAALEADGLNVTDFAYPYGHFSGATPSIVRSCGYQSARGAGGIASQGGCYGECPAAESIAPQNPWDTRAANSILATTSLATIERYVVAAERHGGWLQIVFHYVCDACDMYSVSPQTLAQFLAWLAPRAAAGTRVETVRQVIQTPFAPPAVRIGARSRALRASLACARLPVGTPCVHRRTSRRAAVRATGMPLTVRCAGRASAVRLLIGRRSLRARELGRTGRRWRVAPGPVLGRALLVVRYSLGVAEYPLRLVR